MKKRLADIAYRRSKLLDRIGRQRLEVADTSLRWQKPLALADVAVKAVHFAYAHPALFTGAATALLAIRRKGAISLVRGGWRLLLLYPSAIFVGLKYLSSISRPGHDRPE